MSKTLTKTLLIFFALCWYSAQVSADSVFSFARINVPFEVRVNGSWVEIIENRDDWEKFYIENAGKYLGPNSGNIVVPEIDFGAYTIIAGGLGAGGANRSLMVSGVNASDEVTHVNAVAIRVEGACSFIAIETYPTVVILIPKPEGTLRVNTREAFVYC